MKKCVHKETTDRIEIKHKISIANTKIPKKMIDVILLGLTHKPKKGTLTADAYNQQSTLLLIDTSFVLVDLPIEQSEPKPRYS